MASRGLEVFALEGLHGKQLLLQVNKALRAIHTQTQDLET